MKENRKNTPNVPNLRFPKYNSNWEEKYLSELMTFKNGLNASKDDYGSGYKFINVLDIINNDFIKHDSIIGSVNVKEADFQKNIVEYGDILFQRSSETREEVGQANVYLDEETPSTFGGFVIRGKKKADYNPIFLNYLLKTASARKEITSKSGGSTRYNVGQETLSSVKITIPIIEEQNKIASLLSKIEARISTQSKIIEHQESLMKGFIQQIFSQQLRFKDKNGKDFPDWKNNRLGEIAEIVGGGTPETTKPEYWNGEYNWFTPTEIKQKYIEGSNRKITALGIQKSSARILPEKTLLFTSRATIGDVGITKVECATNQGFQSFLPNGKYDTEFLYYWIKINKKKFIRKSSGSTFIEISKGEIQKVRIQMPSYQEQIRIANFLSSIDDRLETEKQVLKQYKQQKKHLLQNLFV